MKKIVIALVVLAGLGVAVKMFLDGRYSHHLRPAIADADKHNEQMNACVKTALEKHPGAVTEIELEMEDGQMIFDVDIQGKDGKNWEIECGATNGAVVEDKEEKH